GTESGLGPHRRRRLRAIVVFSTHLPGLRPRVTLLTRILALPALPVPHLRKLRARTCDGVSDSPGCNHRLIGLSITDCSSCRPASRLVYPADDRAGRDAQRIAQAKQELQCRRAFVVFELTDIGAIHADPERLASPITPWFRPRQAVCPWPRFGRGMGVCQRF